MDPNDPTHLLVSADVAADTGEPADHTDQPRSSVAAPKPTASALRTEVQQALDLLDAATFQWVRRVQRGEFGRRMIRDLRLDLEPAHFQGLTAIARVQYGVGGSRKGRASVGELAEELSIDPSRASRIAADLVAKGYVRRVASQSDGRQSMLELSPGGVLVMQQVKLRKGTSLARTFAGWPEQDIVVFSRLFARFAECGYFNMVDEDQSDGPSLNIAAALAEELALRQE